ncbi:MAG: hypothetical protein ACLQOO_36590 [Terriglobia bacterium]
MQERKIKAYFKQQVQAIIVEKASDPDGPLDYFAEREPKDAEILGLLAVSMNNGGQSPFREWFPSPLEALAALSGPSRSEICQTFRKELKSHRRATLAV